MHVPTAVSPGCGRGSLASFALRVLQNSVDPGIPIIPESLECLCPTTTGVNLQFLSDLDLCSVVSALALHLDLSRPAPSTIEPARISSLPPLTEEHQRNLRAIGVWLKRCVEDKRRGL